MKQIAFKITILALSVLLFASALFGTILVVATDSANSRNIAEMEKTLREDFDRLVRTQVENAVSMIKILYDKGEAGEITPDQAKILAADTLRLLRYNIEGYFWADTSKGINVVLLGRKDVEGTNRWETKDANGVPFIQEIIKKGMQEGGGYTDYQFPKAGQKVALPKRGYSLYFQPYDWVVGTGAYVDDIDLIVTGKETILNDTSRKLRLIVLLAIAATFLISGLAAYVVGIRLSSQIKLVAFALGDIAQGEGDLTRVIPVKTNDETARISESFNLFTEKLNSVVLSIRDSSNVLAAVGQDLSSNLIESASALNQITANIDNMKQRIGSQAGSLKETSDTMQVISDGIDSLDKLIETQAASVSHSSAAIEEMVSNIASVASNVDRISGRFESLTEASDSGKGKLSEVNRIITEVEHQSKTLDEANAVIKNIAAQTNLLAMNAAIEAAHAGDSGRGFSVVADEIRKLAENSSVQSKAVAENIKTIRASIGKVVQATTDAERSFDETRTMIQEVNELEATVKSSMVEQNEGSRQILHSLAEINSITGDVRASSGKMAQGSVQIREEMGKLLNFTQEISSGMQEISQGTSEINLAINGISDLGVKNRDQVSSLLQETARFKVREKPVA